MKINPNLQKHIDIAKDKASEIYSNKSPNPTHNEELLYDAILSLCAALQLVKEELISIDTRVE